MRKKTEMPLKLNEDIRFLKINKNATVSHDLEILAKLCVWYSRCASMSHNINWKLRFCGLQLLAQASDVFEDV